MILSTEAVLSILQLIGVITIVICIYNIVSSRIKGTGQAKKWQKIENYADVAMMFINVCLALESKVHGRSYGLYVVCAILWGVISVLNDYDIRKK